MVKPTIKEFYDPATYTITYVAYDAATKDAVIIDSVLDYDQGASKVSEGSVNTLVSWIKSQDLKVHYILESHAHADHLTASQVLKEKHFPNAKVGIGARIKDVQNVFKGFFNLSEDFKADGSQFDQLFEDGQTFKAGTLEIKVIYTPGHTPACASYYIGDAVFTGDAIFMPDQGTGRCDFPAGSAEDLYNSVQKLYKLPDETRVFVGHDYQPGGRGLAFETTIGNEKKNNIQLKAETSKEDFVKMRTARDRVLAAPKLLLPSVQVNIMAGHLPKSEANGMSYLKVPIRK